MRHILLVCISILLVTSMGWAEGGGHGDEHGDSGHRGGVAEAISKGSWEVGGGFHFRTKGGDAYDHDGDSKSILEFTPIIGYFVKDRLAVGLEFEYESESQGDDSHTVLGFGPRIVYYPPMHMGPGHPFVEFAYLMLTSTHDDGAHETEEKTSSMLFGLGYDIPLSNHVGLFGLFHFNMNTEEDEHGVELDGTDIGFKVGLQVFIFKL